jgi:trk system potassium uptake protein TrkH
MIDKPINRLKPICYYTGLIVLVLNALQILPMINSALYHEWPILIAFTASLSIAALSAAGLMLAGTKERFAKLSFGEGMVVAAGSWFICMLLSALPYYFSGNYLSYLDTWL